MRRFRSWQTLRKLCEVLKEIKFRVVYFFSSAIELRIFREAIESKNTRNLWFSWQLVVQAWEVNQVLFLEPGHCKIIEVKPTIFINRYLRWSSWMHDLPQNSQTNWVPFIKCAVKNKSFKLKIIFLKIFRIRANVQK